MNTRLKSYVFASLVGALVAYATLAGLWAGEYRHAADLAELAAYRKHQEEVVLWEKWLEKNAPTMAAPGGTRVAMPSALRRGFAELSADNFWPRPDSN